MLINFSLLTTETPLFFSQKELGNPFSSIFHNRGTSIGTMAAVFLNFSYCFESHRSYDFPKMINTC